MLFIGRHKHEERRFNFHHAFNDAEPVKTGHLNVEKHEIGLFSFDLANGFASV